MRFRLRQAVVAIVILICIYLFFTFKNPSEDGAGRPASTSAGLILNEKARGIVSRVALPVFNGRGSVEAPSLRDFYAQIWALQKNWLTAKTITDSERKEELSRVIFALQNAPVLLADVHSSGTQLKLLLTLAGDQKVIFKPKFYARTKVFYGEPYVGHDRHNGEIAGFHLNRVLGFERAPPAVGRVLNTGEDLIAVATARLKETFFRNGSSQCFFGKCLYCKGPADGVCDEGEVMEGALIPVLPSKFGPNAEAGHIGKSWMLQKIRSPWAFTYRDGIKAKWQTDDDFCRSFILLNDTYATNGAPNQRLLDLIDAAVFDYLTSNADRHHYEVFYGIKSSTVILFDSGKTFGNPYFDVLDILAPLYQCCVIRERVFRVLKEVSTDLGAILEEILRGERIHPVLTQDHYEALTRRARIIVKVVENCISQNGESRVLFQN